MARRVGYRTVQVWKVLESGRPRVVGRLGPQISRRLQSYGLRYNTGPTYSKTNLGTGRIATAGGRPIHSRRLPSFNRISHCSWSQRESQSMHASSGKPRSPSGTRQIDQFSRFCMADATFFPYVTRHHSIVSCNKLPFTLGEIWTSIHLIYGTLDPPAPPSQTASRSIHNTRSLPTDRQTDRQTE